MPVYSPKQADVILNANASKNLLSGAVRSGKTFVTYDLIPKRLATLPEGNRLLVGKTERTLKRNVIDPMQERFGRKYVSDISNGECTILGKRFYIVGANDERAAEKIQGMGLVYCAADEITTYPDSFLRMLWSRLSAKGATFDGTCNPQNQYHPVKTEIIDRAEEVGAKVWHFTIDDNPFLDPIFVDTLKRQYTGVWYQRYILGLWVAAEGAIYDMLDATRHVVADANLPAMKRYWVGVDYGPGSVTTFLLIGFGADGCFYILARWRWDVALKFSQKADPQLIEELDRWLDAWGVTPEAIVVPHDAQSFAILLQQTRGKLKRAKRLAWADQSPGSVLRGIQDVATLLATDKLKFAKSLADQGGLVEWQGYVWDPKAQERGEDAPLKQNDHDPDAGRYALQHARAAWMPELRR